MHRTNIYLDEETVRNLKLLAAARNTTMSELVRDAVDALMARGHGRVDWNSEIRHILDEVEQRDLSELSAGEIACEVRAVRAGRARSAVRGDSEEPWRYCR